MSAPPAIRWGVLSAFGTLQAPATALPTMCGKRLESQDGKLLILQFGVRLEEVGRNHILSDHFPESDLHGGTPIALCRDAQVGDMVHDFLHAVIVALDACHGDASESTMR